MNNEYESNNRFNHIPQNEPSSEPEQPSAHAPTTPEQAPPMNTSEPGWNSDSTPPTQHTPPTWQAEHIPGWNTESTSTHDMRTPYQTPVRGASSGGSQHAEPYTQTHATSSPMDEAQSSYTSYQQWQEQSHTPQQEKKNHKHLLRVVCGVVAACVVFAGGAFAGIQLYDGGNSLGSGASQAVSDAANKPTPTLTISSTDDTEGGLTGEQIYAKVSPSVVSIVATSLNQSGTASGSGVIMTEDGYIITNAHVIEDADKVTVVTSDGMQYNAQIIGADSQTDLAVLKLNESVKFTAAEFGDSDNLQTGEKAYAIGSPGGLQLANSITTGSISAINRDITIDDRVMTLIQTDASINPGNSGGALINKHGQVIGITSAKLGISYFEGLGFAIPIDSAKEIVDQIIAYGYVPGRPAIGITGYNLDERTAQYNNVPQGVVITEVDPRSDAAAKGLQAKDIIIGVNGTTITTMDEINAVKQDLKAGDQMTLKVYRLGTGKTMEIAITLADANDLSSSNTVNLPTLPETTGPSSDDYSWFFGR